LRLQRYLIALMLLQCPWSDSQTARDKGPYFYSPLKWFASANAATVTATVSWHGCHRRSLSASLAIRHKLGLNGRPVWFNSATPNCKLGPGPLRHWQPEPSVSSGRTTQTHCALPWVSCHAGWRCNQLRHSQGWNNGSGSGPRSAREPASEVASSNRMQRASRGAAPCQVSAR
jgi:hypothetical protein